MAHPSDHEPATPGTPRHRTGSAMGFGNLLILVVVYAALMIVLALNLSQDVFVPLFAEGGPFESLTIGFWLLLAALCFTLPGLPRRPWDSGIVALLAAAREADLHKAFTDMSVLKTSYYLKSAAPPFEKLIAALVTLPALALVIYVLVAGARFIRRTGAWRLDWGRTTLLAMGLLVASKMLDRVEAVTADWFGLHFSPLAHNFIAAFEEGVECLLPVLFIAALLQYQYLHLAGENGNEARGAGTR